MQAAGHQQVGGVTQQDLAPCGQMGQGLCQLYKLPSVLHLLCHIVHLCTAKFDQRTDWELHKHLSCLF